MQSKKGVLLINVGTPKQADKKHVRRYLSEFLGDPRVIDLPWMIRKALLNFVILPFRTAQSVRAYQTIWDKSKGSPLLYGMRSLALGLQQYLGNDYSVAFGMRYGNPSIKTAIYELLQNGCNHIDVIPLYPQYSSAATGSAVEAVFDALKNELNYPNLNFLNAFFDHPLFLGALQQLIQSKYKQRNYDKLVFSYHSLPWRQIKKSAQCPPECVQEKPCSTITQSTQYCYRSQCFATARLLSQSMNLADSEYEVVFQSRIGKTPWVGPDLIESMPKWIAQGVKSLFVVCPSFVVDCLETLEEVGMRAKETWHHLGGEVFELSPCLNSQPFWLESLGKIIKN